MRKDSLLFPSVIQTAGSDWRNLESYTENTYNSARMVGWDSYLGAQLDVRRHFDTRWPSFVKTGLRFRQQTRDLDNTPYRTSYVGPDGVMGPNPANGGRNDDNLAQFGLVQRPFPETRLNRYGPFPFPGLQAVGRVHQLDSHIEANPTDWRRTLAADLQTALRGNQQFEEQVRAAYVMGNVRFGRLNVLTGVRVEDTETEGTGSLQVVTPEERAARARWGSAPLTDAEIERRAYEEFGRRQTRTGDYRSVFPSLHLKYQFSPNRLARFSYSETIGRPSIGQLIPNTTVNYDNQTVATSNPSLEPQWSENYDFSIEMYFEPAGLFSVGVFQKDIEKFIYNASAGTIGTGANNGFSGDFEGFELRTQFNGGFAKVKGIEISYNQQLTFLPGIWKGLGAFANATWMNAEGNYGSGTAISLAPNPRVAGFNPFITNAGLSYIRGKWNLRATYNYRHKYLVGFNANESRATYAAARPTLDIKTLYNIISAIEAAGPWRD